MHTLITRSVIGCLLLITAVGELSAQSHTIILGRPTDRSVTASVLFDQQVSFAIEYGTMSGIYDVTTSTLTSVPSVPDEVDLTGLVPNTRYYYRLLYRKAGVPGFTASPEYVFYTQRAQNSTFRFLVEADEHLYDKKGVRSMYQTTLRNQAKDSADFLLSLGDTFGDDHTPSETTSEDMDALHKDYLQYLGTVCHSMPFFFCLGNHEGETGYYLKQDPPNNIAVYGTLWRKHYYPNPFPNEFYSGNTRQELHNMGLPENYYAWTWGDALFVVLDVYRHCDVNDKPQNWDWTLGEEQYQWLRSTLSTSSARYKFVFAHHTRGQGRGGIKTAKGFEWGGYETNRDRYEFDTKRPGWELPIHQLMVKYGVNIFFQGHDHLYAKEELDGLVYQEVPMAADSTYEIGMLANADAYTDVVLDGTGHIRVTVAPEQVTVDFIRAYLPADTVDGAHHNGEIAHSYVVRTRTTDVTDDVRTKQYPTVSPNPASDRLNISPGSTDGPIDVRLYDMYGQSILYSTHSAIDVSHIPNGIYVIGFVTPVGHFTEKIIIRH